jgi:hypothetical protein
VGPCPAARLTSLKEVAYGLSLDPPVIQGAHTASGSRQAPAASCSQTRYLDYYLSIAQGHMYGLLFLKKSHLLQSSRLYAPLVLFSLPPYHPRFLLRSRPTL